MGCETCQMNKCSYKDEIYILRGVFFGGGVGEGWQLDIERISERKCEMMETWINNLEVLTVAQNMITYMSATVVMMTTSLIIWRVMLGGVCLAMSWEFLGLMLELWPCWATLLSWIGRTWIAFLCLRCRCWRGWKKGWQFIIGCCVIGVDEIGGLCMTSDVENGEKMIENGEKMKVLRLLT